MRLASDDTIITIAGEAGPNTVTLRPSLRAAVRLERQFNGFRPLLQAILDGSLTAFAAIIAECGEHSNSFEFITQPDPEPLADRLARITPAIVALVLELADTGPADASEKDFSEAPKVPLADAYKQIFGVATGILGWSPATAWSATIPEITCALAAHVSLLRAQNGAPDPDPPAPTTRPSTAPASPSLPRSTPSAERTPRPCPPSIP